METQESRREALCARLLVDFDELPKFIDGEENDGGIVGVTEDGRLVYSYSRLVKSLADYYGWSEADAMEWVGFNIIRSLPYEGPKAPILISDIDIDSFGEGPKPCK